MLDKLRDVCAAEEVLGAAERTLGWSLRDTLASAPDLYTNRVAQPLICIGQLATWEAIKRDLPAPALFAGYSVGELAAYGCAASLTAGALAYLAVQRAAIMDEGVREPGALVAVSGGPTAALMELCEQCQVDIAIVNGPEHFVLGGPSHAIQRFEEAAAARAFRVTPLNVAVPAHTSLLSPAIDRFRTELERCAMTNPTTPVLAGITGLPIRTRSAAIEHLSRQIGETVRWESCMETALEMGCTVFLELGPGQALSRMVIQRYPHLQARSTEEFRSLTAVSRWVEEVL
ncbi:MAG: acyltransferase domain-containing protein [Luteitalea sp.]|nr:acyltransferase domain-containing protein [Luteitalea sp.]